MRETLPSTALLSAQESHERRRASLRNRHPVNPIPAQSAATDPRTQQPRQQEGNVTLQGQSSMPPPPTPEAPEAPPSKRVAAPSHSHVTSQRQHLDAAPQPDADMAVPKDGVDSGPKTADQRSIGERLVALVDDMARKTLAIIVRRDAVCQELLGNDLTDEEKVDLCEMFAGHIGGPLEEAHGQFRSVFKNDE